MRLAWFRASAPDARASHDAGATLAGAIGRVHDVEFVTEAEAHDFVWKHDREPYDLCIYEIGRNPAREFPWSYLLHYPGVLLLSNLTLADPRGWGRSRAVVVADAAVAQSLAAEWPEARLRVVPLGSDPGDRATQPIDTGRHRGQTPIRVAVLGEGRRDVVERAVARAEQRGASVTLLPDLPPEDVLRQADVIIAAEWPPAAGPPFAALQAMAVSLPVIVLEVEATAAWPALDPQTWLPRGFSTDGPLVISVDPRDEEHSLVLAIVRLAADPRLRDALGAAGHAWWRAHARVDDATVAFEQVLREAATLGPAATVRVLDGSGSARAVLAEIGVDVDFL